ncbi:MAG: sulfite exporter TauE/SafE family protein [Rhodobacterales bacterium]
MDTGLVIIAFALGGILKGATGAGAPVIAVPLMTIFFGAPFAVAVFSIPNLVTNIWQGWVYRDHVVKGPLMLRFAVAGALGAGIGSFMLAWLPTEALTLTVALSVLAYVGFRAARPGWTLALPHAERLAAPLGLLGGILQGAAGLSAPVSLSFLNAIRLERGQFIVTISVFFFGMALVQIPLLTGLGILTAERFLLSCLALVPLMATMPLGAWLARRISANAFDRVILVLLVLLSLRLIWQAVFG